MALLVLLLMKKRVALEAPLPLRICRLASYGDGHPIKGEVPP
jgi:hypothetical protein